MNAWGAPFALGFRPLEMADSKILEESEKLVEKNGLKVTTILERGVGNPVDSYGSWKP